MAKIKQYTAKQYGKHNPNELCPCCKVAKLGEHPAISRNSVGTLLCTECGVNEAMLIYLLQKNPELLGAVNCAKYKGA